MTRTAKEIEKANQRNAVLSGFLGWTLDAFDFFVLIFVVPAVAKDFDCSIPAVALTITASLAMRPVGALLFGVMADRHGRRKLLMANIIFYSVMEILSGLAPKYETFLVFRLLYGIGMGGTWGVGASLAIESVQGNLRGLVSGLLQEGYAVGNILAALCYFTIFPRWGWRPMFFLGAIPALLILLICSKVQESEAWQTSRTEWSAYRQAIAGNWKLFCYLVVLMAMMNFMSHGTQDMYPTFLQRQRNFPVTSTAMITVISMIGAICGGIAFGLFSDRWGRRRAMIAAALLGALAIPLWVFATRVDLIVIGAFAMQFMVQGAWGVIPAHLIELSPGQLRAFFPGFAYQLGVLIASTAGYIEAVMGEHFRYATSMGLFAGIVLTIGAGVIYIGPEARGLSFVNGQALPSSEMQKDSELGFQPEPLQQKSGNTDI